MSSQQQPNLEPSRRPINQRIPWVLWPFWWLWWLRPARFKGLDTRSKWFVVVVAVAVLGVSGALFYPELGQVSATNSCNTAAVSVSNALERYKGLHGSYPTPEEPWSASTYAGNYAALVKASTKTGLLALVAPPRTSRYVVEYDSTGHIWVEGPGVFLPSNDPSNEFPNNVNVCEQVTGG
jgi:hypothetical protein